MPSSVKNASRLAVRKAPGTSTTAKRPTTQQLNRRAARAARRAAERRRRNRIMAFTATALVVLLAFWVFHDRLPSFGGNAAKGQTVHCPAPTATPIGPQPQLNPPDHPPALPKDVKTQSLQASYTDAQGSSKTAKMQYAIITAGCGPVVAKDDNVTVIYSGWTQANGKLFDSSLQHGGTFKVLLVGDPEGQQQLSSTGTQAGVIAGWNNGLIGMKPGETRRLIIPAEVGYGAQGNPPVIPGNATLIFDVTLVSIDSHG